MRRTIETAPRDGQAIILEDDESGTYDVAHWSAEAGEWVAENGEPSKITPTHWHPMSREKYLLQEAEGSSKPSQVGRSASRARRSRRYSFFGDYLQEDEGSSKPSQVGRSASRASSITTTLIAAALIGLYLYVTRYAGQQDIARISTIGGQVVAQETPLPRQDSRKPDLWALQQQAEADQARAQAGAQEAAQLKQAVEASAPEARQSPENEQSREVLANELAEARRAIDGLNLKLRAEAAKTAQSLGQEREKTAALVQDVTAARQELTASTVQHRHALEEERARGAALASELAMARREIETQVALLRKAGDEAVQFKQAAESAMAELRQSLQQERDRAEALASELAMARRDVETQVALFAQTTGTVDPSPAPAEPSMKEDVPPGGCMPIVRIASGEIVFPIQCKEFIERQRGQAVEQEPAAVEETPAAKQSEGR